MRLYHSNIVLYAIYEVTGHLSEGSLVRNVAVQCRFRNLTLNLTLTPTLTLALSLTLTLTPSLYVSEFLCPYQILSGQLYSFKG